METNKKKSLKELEKEESLMDKMKKGILKYLYRPFNTVLKQVTLANVLSVLIFIATVYININIAKMASVGRAKVADQIIEEMNEGIMAVNHYRTSVVLPDSLEQRTDVQQIRRLQDRICAWEIAYSSLVQRPDFSDSLIDSLGKNDEGLVDRGKGLEKQMEALIKWYESLSRYTVEQELIANNFQIILNMIPQIGDVSSITFNFLTLNEILVGQRNPWGNLKHKLKLINENKKLKREEMLHLSICSFKEELFDSGRLLKYFRLNHKYFMMQMKTLTDYLLYLQNWQKEKAGRLYAINVSTKDTIETGLDRLCVDDIVLNAKKGDSIKLVFVPNDKYKENIFNEVFTLPDGTKIKDTTMGKDFVYTSTLEGFKIRDNAVFMSAYSIIGQKVFSSGYVNIYVTE